MCNNTNTKAVSFWNYLKDNTIEIPIIQRDYAHGRLGKENLRKNFLADLKKALDNESLYKDNPMKMDFIYGSIENGKMHPLDGQQRLTTLWLLHWYIALRAGELNDKNCSIFQRFSYETRISSREFCENLCIPANFKDFPGNDIILFITKQTWFYSIWKQDPTIQSMLRMLGGTKIANKKGEDIVDGIEELFQHTNKEVFQAYWQKLTEKETIVFYHLPLSLFSLSDDLYIKMNARGKQLTGFENFKADLIGYITKQSENESLEDSIRKKWKELLDPNNGIPIKMDTDWTDIFWKNKSKDNRIDEIFFAFLNRFFWNELFIAKKPGDSDSFVLNIGKGDESSTQENNNRSYMYLNNSDYPNDFDTTIAYEGLDVYKFYEGSIPLSLFQKLVKVLNGYLYYSESNTLPKCSWDTDFEFIPRYVVENTNNIEISNNANEKILKVTTLNQVQRVVYFAICKYFNDSSTVNIDYSSIKQWMRVVWNLVSGYDINGRPQIRSTHAMRTAMSFLSDLNSHDVYNSLIDYDTQKLGNSDFDERCKEEISKAKQILDDNRNLREYDASCKKEDGSDYHTWEEIIINAENYAFFKGSIKFLYTNGEGGINWYDNAKWTNFKKYFDKKGVSEYYRKDALLLRALLNQIDIAEKWFGNSKEFWCASLLNKCYQGAIHKLLMANQIKVETISANNWISDKNLLYNLLNHHNSWHILTNWRGYSVLTQYTQRRSDATSHKEIVVLNELRNRLLNDRDIVITDDRKVEGTSYLYGWIINFKYNDNNFQWAEDNTVYLMTKDAPNKYANINSEKPNSINSFDASDIREERFKEQLDILIKHNN